MYSLITSYLLQSKECTLPGIGSFKINSIPAIADAANKQILPPNDEIFFTEKENVNFGGLAKYIAAKKNIDIKSAEEQLNDFCKEWNGKIKTGEELHFETIGTIKKNSEGNIYFEKAEKLNYLQPIQVENIYEKEEPLTVEEPEETVVVEQEDYNNGEIVTKRPSWGIWAVSLMVISFAVIFYHFYDHRLSSSSLGNQNKLLIDSASATYSVPSK